MQSIADGADVCSGSVDRGYSHPGHRLGLSIVYSGRLGVSTSQVL
jgi:hypothetical protein